MFKNYLLTAYRNIIRQKSYSAINIIGFAIGLAVCLAISFYVIDDLTYDRFHEDAEDIYHLLTLDSDFLDNSLSYSITAGPLVAGLKDNIPEVIAATRITLIGLNLELIGEDEQEKDNVRGRAIATDPDFFEIFDFEILESIQDSPLEDYQGVYITHAFKNRLFGDQEALGQIIPNQRLENAYVAGYVEEPPRNSHIQFDAIIKLNVQDNPVWWDSWENLALIGYLKTTPNANPQVVEQKIIEFGQARGLAEVFKPGLQRLLDVHLDSNHLRYDYLNIGKNDKVKVYTMAIIALLVLIIASINFINLSSARSIKRAKEVGLRKVVGGTRIQLFYQFIFESILTTFLAMILALGLFEIFLPYLNDFFQKNLSLNLIENFHITISLIIFSFVIGFLSGIYPALVLSRYKPIIVLRGKPVIFGRTFNFRHLLVLCQFAVSIALIASVFIVLQQIDYLTKIDLGYVRENIIVINNFDNDPFILLKEELKNQNYVESVAGISNLPGGTLVRLEVVPEGFATENGYMFDRILIDEEAINTLKIDMLNGRNFSSDLNTDAEESIIINETAAKKLGWDNPIGKSLTMVDENENRLTRRIIGVINDVNFTTIRRKVNPMILVYSPEFSPLMLVKIKPEYIAEIEVLIEPFFTQYFPEIPLRFDFLDDVFVSQFKSDRSFGINIAVFSALAIFIACLGLLGLASYETQQRKREIAIRKVLGSSVKNIVLLLSKHFTIWVLLANLIAWPLTYFSMNIWLDNFAYKTSFSILIFFAAGGIALIIALITVSAQTFKAANSDPVNSLKYE